MCWSTPCTSCFEKCTTETWTMPPLTLCTLPWDTPRGGGWQVPMPSLAVSWLRWWRGKFWLCWFFHCQVDVGCFFVSPQKFTSMCKYGKWRWSSVTSSATWNNIVCVFHHKFFVLMMLFWSAYGSSTIIHNCGYILWFSSWWQILGPPHLSKSD